MKAAFRFDIAFALMCVLCASVFFVSAAVSADLRVRQAEIMESKMPEREEEAPESLYKLMEYGGRIYVYSGGRPFAVTDIDPAGLPGGDREKLKRGIGAESRESLLELIEDFGS